MEEGYSQIQNLNPRKANSSLYSAYFSSSLKGCIPVQNSGKI